MIIDENELGFGPDYYYYYRGERFTGTAVEKLKGKAAEESNYTNGIPDGLDREWDENGTLIFEMQWEMGAQEGWKRGWYLDGKLLPEALYECDVMVQHRIWDKEGNLVKDFVIKEGDEEYKLLLQRRMRKKSQ